jgi:hypothetical protein
MRFAPTPSSPAGDAAMASAAGIVVRNPSAAVFVRPRPGVRPFALPFQPER